MKYQDNILFIYCLHSIKIVTNGQSILLRFNVLGVLSGCWRKKRKKTKSF